MPINRKLVVAIAAAAVALSGQKKEDDLKLRDFEPKSMLHVAEHRVERAKFPVIDVHQHVNDSYDWPGVAKKNPADVVKLMDQLNIRKMIILTGQWGDKLQGVLDRMVKPYPDRFQVYTQVDWSRIDEPNFGEAMAEQIRDSVKRGARGLKVMKDLGLGVKDKTGKLITVDDPRLDPIWAECGKLRIPVSIHVGDPEAFFHPIDRFNERYAELNRYPDWSFCCPPKFPTFEEILAARDRVLARHPKTTFILLHVGHWPENLDFVDATLRRFPNTYVELGAREAELGRQPRRAREFFLKNADRIMFGTDMDPEVPLYQNYFRWLETADEYFDYFGFPGQGFFKIYGVELPDNVLKKVYSENAERVMRQFKPM